MSIQRHIVEASVFTAYSVPDECSAGVADLVRQCMEHMPSRRPSAMQVWLLQLLLKLLSPGSLQSVNPAFLSFCSYSVASVRPVASTAVCDISGSQTLWIWILAKFKSAMLRGIYWCNSPLL